MENNNNKEIEKKVIEVIALRLGIPVKNISPASFFYDDLNAGKLEIADIIQILEDKFNFKFDIEEVKNFTKVADLIEYVKDNVE